MVMFRAVLPGPKGEERIVAPYSSTGNTGTLDGLPFSGELIGLAQIPRYTGT